MSEHKGWYWPRHLPHRDEPGLVQAITFRLHDSLPQSWLRQQAYLQGNPNDDPALEQRLLDQGLGACTLGDSRAAEIVEQCLLYGDGTRYVLLAWVVMPNHVHVLIATVEGWPLSRVIGGWKSFSARRINAALARTGPLWGREYHDRYVRDEVHLGKAVYYVHNNPVAAGLVDRPEDWPYSSARRVDDVYTPFHMSCASRP